MEKNPRAGTTLKSYASRVFKESAVGMVSSLAETKSTSRRLFKAFVLIFCLTGFFYQSAKFLLVVFTYPSVVAIDILRPETINVPGFSFCNNNEIQRSLYCLKYPERCEEPTEAFCKKFDWYCGQQRQKVPKKQFYTLYDMQPEEVIELNANLSDFLTVMMFTGQEVVTGPHLRPKYGDDENFTIMLCYTWNDRVDNSLDPLLAVPKRGVWRDISYKFKFKVDPYEAFLPGIRSGLLFSVHSPFEAVNPFEKGIFMKPGRTYVIYTSMEEEQLLKEPYDTDCTNYTELWEQNGYRGPRTQEMCEEKCGTDIAKLCYNCNMIDFMYPTEGRLCQQGDFVDCPGVDERYNKCIRACKDDCHVTKYKFQVQERYNVQYDKNGEIIEDIDSLIVVEIHMEQDEIVVLKHSPKYMIVEMFSTIGGFVGGWLGISLLDVTDILEGFFRIFRYSIKKMQRN